MHTKHFKPGLGCLGVISEWAEAARGVKVNPPLLHLCAMKWGNNQTEEVNLWKNKLGTTIMWWSDDLGFVWPLGHKFYYKQISDVEAQQLCLLVKKCETQRESLNWVNPSCFENDTREMSVTHWIRCASHQCSWVLLLCSLGSLHFWQLSSVQDVADLCLWFVNSQRQHKDGLVFCSHFAEIFWKRTNKRLFYKSKLLQGL